MLIQLLVNTILQETTFINIYANNSPLQKIIDIKSKFEF
jgi:hypothetical protein